MYKGFTMLDIFDIKVHQMIFVQQDLAHVIAVYMNNWVDNVLQCQLKLMALWGASCYSMQSTSRRNNALQTIL